MIYFSKERIKVGELFTYEAFGESVNNQRICTRSGYHKYNVALISSMIAEHGAAKAKTWLQGLKKIEDANLAETIEVRSKPFIKDCVMSCWETHITWVKCWSVKTSVHGPHQ